MFAPKLFTCLGDYNRKQFCTDLVAGIECPTRVIFADPAQPYLPDPLRREHAALLPRGELTVMAGGHHLHMEDPAAVAAVIGDFFTATR